MQRPTKGLTAGAHLAGRPVRCSPTLARFVRGRVQTTCAQGGSEPQGAAESAGLFGSRRQVLLGLPLVVSGLDQQDFIQLSEFTLSGGNANGPKVSREPPFSMDEERRLWGYFFGNIHPSGRIVAAPSQNHPDYFYTWVRDEALCMGVVLDGLESGQVSHETAMPMLKRYVDWVIDAQHAEEPHFGQPLLGEPKYNMDGTVYRGDWMRPQNDGPALRAITTMRIANYVLANEGAGGHQLVADDLYCKCDSWNAIQTDLDYVVDSWNSNSYDVWEESWGKHYFTAMVQRRALIDGAAFAKSMGDKGKAALYQEHADRMTNHVRKFWNPKTGVIMATLSPHSWPSKEKELDSAVLLATLYGYTPSQPVWPATSPEVMSTLDELCNHFGEAYPVNRRASSPETPRSSVMLGRYPGDIYDGYARGGGGNPWVLTTCGAAEVLYRRAAEASSQREWSELVTKGDGMLMRIREHVEDNETGFHLPEQINLVTGKPQGAPDLSWSYATLISALRARQTAMGMNEEFN